LLTDGGWIDDEYFVEQYGGSHSRAQAGLLAGRAAVPVTGEPRSRSASVPPGGSGGNYRAAPPVDICQEVGELERLVGILESDLEDAAWRRRCALDAAGPNVDLAYGRSLTPAERARHAALYTAEEHWKRCFDAYEAARTRLSSALVAYDAVSSPDLGLGSRW
jgi:hypothetical protein